MSDGSGAEARGEIAVAGVHKSFRSGEHTVEVLRGVDLEVDAGSSVALVGPSGSGKSTLLHLLGALDRPDEGTIEVDGIDLGRLDESGLARFRSLHVGFVFQDHHLLPQYTVLQNVLLPVVAAGRDAREGDHRRRAADLLAAVGLDHRVDHRPAQLSGGERQRTALARALINRPKLVLCDEPTGNLDSASAEQVVEQLGSLQRSEGSALVVVTHDSALAARMGRCLRMSDGRLEASSGAVGGVE